MNWATGDVQGDYLVVWGFFLFHWFEYEISCALLVHYFHKVAPCSLYRIPFFLYFSLFFLLFCYNSCYFLLSLLVWVVIVLSLHLFNFVSVGSWSSHYKFHSSIILRNNEIVDFSRGYFLFFATHFCMLN